MSDKQHKIVKLEAENYLRLSAVQITPKGNLVELTGKNGAGKSSILGAIMAAINGADSIPEEPIRRGAKEARIKLDMGDIIVTRKLRKRADGTTDIGSVVVEAANGARFTKPQQMLDGMLGKLTLDPIAFANAKPAEQFETLKQLVPGVDFAGIEGQNQTDYEKRTEVNRRAKEARAAADLVAFPIDTPDAPVDEAALVDELAKAGEQNATLQARKERRTATAEKVVADTNRVADLRGRIDGRLKDIADRGEERLGALLREIERLQAEVETVKQQIDSDLATTRAALTKEADDLEAEVQELQQRLDTAEALPAPIDTAELQAKIAAARKTNADAALKRRKATLLAEAIDAEAESAKLTETMEARTAAKEKAIAESNLPVPGIGFGKDKKGDPTVTLDGLPFKQASEAGRLRTSIAVAMALNPRLKVILVPSGNGLDADAMQIVMEMADKHDCQVWIETVRSDERVAFVIEDGRLAGASAAEPQEAA